MATNAGAGVREIQTLVKFVRKNVQRVMVGKGEAI